jgi:AmmeMemoRadiSam system protein B/AmmeMemoRadiSam system protein A
MTIVEKTLKSQVAGGFYPSNKEDLENLLKELFSKARNEQQGKLNSVFKAMVIPHAGYIYSGLTAAHAYKYFTPKKFKKVFVLGPAHKHNFDGVAVYPQSSYETPLGISPRAEIDSSLGFHFDQEPFKGEHSVETHLPFIQYRLSEENIRLENYPITLLVYGNISPQKLAKKLDNLLDEESFLILSSDLSHFNDLETCISKDELSIQSFLEGNPDKASTADACGKMGVAAFLSTNFSRSLEGEFIHYSNSASVNGDRNRVVGYCAIGYSENLAKEPFSKDVVQLQLTPQWKNIITTEMQNDLLMTIRSSIKEFLEEKKVSDLSLMAGKYYQLNQDAATFVTLTKHDKLRGCIGSLQPHRSLLLDSVTNGIKAATEDPRFEALNINELKDIKIEVSILGTPSFLRCTSEFDLLSKIIPFQHGVIIQQGNKRATFLPQVWGQFNSKVEFLNQLCRKASIKEDAWRIPSEKIQVFVYEVFSFKEI